MFVEWNKLKKRNTYDTLCVCVREGEREREGGREGEKLSEIRQEPPNTQAPTTSSSFKNILPTMMSPASILSFNFSRIIDYKNYSLHFINIIPKVFKN